mmetsp:Transcript_28619/g.80694  ORF Transcript_28619/g.80694 Transcript_28619/m.80694 type:complete len:212 (+) Transcript_28619:197-832(+)
MVHATHELLQESGWSTGFTQSSVSFMQHRVQQEHETAGGNSPTSPPMQSARRYAFCPEKSSAPVQNTGSRLPVTSVVRMSTFCSCVHAESSSGNVPLMEDLSMSNRNILTQLPISLGMGPLKSEFDNWSASMLTNDPISVGKLPSIFVKLITNSRSCVRRPMLLEIDPTMSLSLISSMANFSRWKITCGISPVNRLERMLKSVTSLLCSSQ